MTTITSKYGITEHKNAELDALTTEVTDAQYLVNENQAVVDSLTDKSNQFSGFLADALNQKDIALSNLKLVEEVVNTINDLMGNISTVVVQTTSADLKIAKTAENVNILIGQLIFCADLVDKLNSLIIKKKALNPLISDELVSVMSTASTDANNAVAVTLTALQSCYAAMASSSDALDITVVETGQTRALLALITGDKNDPSDFIQAIGLAQKQLGSLTDKTTTVTAVEEQLASALTTAKEAQDTVNTSKQDVTDAQNTVTKAQTGNNAGSQADGGASGETSTSSVSDINTAMTSLSKAQTDLISNTENLELAQQLVGEWQSALQEAVSQLKSDNVSFTNTAGAQQNDSLQSLLSAGYAMSVVNYSQSLRANNRVTAELDEATSNLTKSQASLASLEAGLTAATAAAMAA